MKNTKVYLYAASLIVCAGTTLNTSAAEATDSADSSSRPPYHPWTVGAEVGSTGIGGFGSWRFYDHLGVRAGFDYFQWTEKDLSIGDFNYNVKARLMSEPLTLDIYPWQKHSFHVSVGMLFNQNQLTGSSSGVADLGVLDLKIQQQVVNPYRKISKAVSPIRAAQFLQVENQVALFVDMSIASEMPEIAPSKLQSPPK